MTASPASLPPITKEWLLDIIKGLKGGYVPPLDDDLTRLEVALIHMRYSNLPPREEFHYRRNLPPEQEGRAPLERAWMEPVFCAKCGKGGGLVTPGSARHVLFICDDCATPGMAEMPEPLPPGSQAPSEQGAPDFPIRLGTGVSGNEVAILEPMWPGGKLPFDWETRKRPDGTVIGHPRRFKNTWHDLAPGMITEFLPAMTPTNSDSGFAPNKSYIARCLEKVIPRVTGEKPRAATIRQWLLKPYERKRPRRRLR